MGGRPAGYYTIHAFFRESARQFEQLLIGLLQSAFTVGLLNAAGAWLVVRLHLLQAMQLM